MDNLGHHPLPDVFAFCGTVKRHGKRRGTHDHGKATRQFVLKRDGHKCVQCGATERLTMDHIKPKSKGGKWTPDNLQTMCAECNGKKGDR